MKKLAKKDTRRLENYRRFPEILDALTTISIGMFDYNPPKGLEKQTCERGLLGGGIAALYKLPSTIRSVNAGNWCVTPAHAADVKNNNGVADRVTTEGTDYALELDIKAGDAILLYNNSLKTPDDLTQYYALMLGETDKSILSLLKWSRLSPIPKCSDDDDVAKMTEIVRRVLDGELETIASDNTDMFSSAARSRYDDVLDLTDPTAVEKMHFLSEFREELLKRWATLNGVPFNTTAKSAQALNAELHGMDIFSLFIPFDKYNARKDNFERAAEFTGHNWAFDWSNIMKTQFVKSRDNEGAPNDTKTEGTDGENKTENTDDNGEKDGENDEKI